ncbi:hypothetical protein EDB19DRAFT_903110 [Suillus lakei]|nr:hypothetical protein EDB19DRAFT_903110 [Suillus lakei]
MILTGNVQVSPQHLTLGRDIVVPPTLNAEDIRPFEKLAEVIHGAVGGTRSLAIMQLSHAGRQSVNLLVVDHLLLHHWPLVLYVLGRIILKIVEGAQSLT